MDDISMPYGDDESIEESLEVLSQNSRKMIDSIYEKVVLKRSANNT